MKYIKCKNLQFEPTSFGDSLFSGNVCD